MTKNHELLNRAWIWLLTFEERLARKADDDRKFGNSATLNQRNGHLKSKLDLPVWHHLGFGVVDDLPVQLNMGMDLAVDYFWRDWWTPQGLDRLMTLEQQHECGLDTPEKRGAFLQNNARALDKSHSERKLQWFTALQAGLFFGGLLGRWDDIAKLCSWFDATVEPEYTAGMIEDQYFGLYLCMAGKMGLRSMEGLETQFENVQKARSKRVRLLASIWEAAFSLDQEEFEKRFVASVKHFLSKPSDVKIASEWVALDESIIWLMAEHWGLRFPSMSEKNVAAVITRESLGLVN